jgi:hypothetical protein
MTGKFIERRLPLADVVPVLVDFNSIANRNDAIAMPWNGPLFSFNKAENLVPIVECFY